jgi:hypothetical protein
VTPASFQGVAIVEPIAGLLCRRPKDESTHGWLQDEGPARNATRAFTSGLPPCGGRRRAAVFSSPAVSGGQIAEHILQDAAVSEIFELVDRVDPADDRHVLHRAVTVGDSCFEFLPGPNGLQPLYGHRLVPL